MVLRSLGWMLKRSRLILCVFADCLVFTFFGKGFLIDGLNLSYLFMFYVYAKKPRGNIHILNKFNK